MSKDRYIWLSGKNILVSEELYLTYYHSEWVEQKRIERGRRCRKENGNRCIDDCNKCNKTPTGVVLSLDKLLENGYEASTSNDVAELVMDRLLLDELYTALMELTNDERDLINGLYFNNQTAREYARKTDISHTSVNRHHKNIIKKLRSILKNY